jgi:hypothetical protein
MCSGGCTDLRREWQSTRSTERLSESPNHEVGVERYALKPAHAERRKPVVVLQVAEGPLYGCAAPAASAAFAWNASSRCLAASALVSSKW